MKASFYTALFCICLAFAGAAQTNLAEYNAFRIRNNFEVYPNPADDRITFDSPVEYDWQIADQQGNIWMSGRALAGRYPLEIYRLQPGTYYVRFITRDETSIRQLIVR